MNKNRLIPLSQFIKPRGRLSSLSNTSVILDKRGIPSGFVFGRDSFISLCTILDNEFEKRVADPKKAYDNPAGRLIDLIEERLPINPDFSKDLKSSIRSAKRSGWISLEEITRMLNV